MHADRRYDKNIPYVVLRCAALLEAYDKHLDKLATRNEIAAAAAELHGRMDSLDTKLNGRMDTLEATLTGQTALLRWMGGPSMITMLSVVLGLAYVILGPAR